MGGSPVLDQLDALALPVGTSCLLAGVGAVELEAPVRDRIGPAARLVVADGTLPGSKFDLAVVVGDLDQLEAVAGCLWAGGTLLLSDAGPDGAERLAAAGFDVLGAESGSPYGKLPRFATGH